MGCTGLDGVNITCFELNYSLEFIPEKPLPENEILLEYECLLYQN